MYPVSVGHKVSVFTHCDCVRVQNVGLTIVDDAVAVTPALVTSVLTDTLSLHQTSAKV